MLDPWIIEEIKRREREENHRQPAVVEFPLHGPQDKPEEKKPGKDEDNPRGVVIIDYSVG